MLPGDYIAFKLTGEIATTINGLSEGMLWDFKEKKVANWLLDYYGIETKLDSSIVNNFEDQGSCSHQELLRVDCQRVYQFDIVQVISLTMH